VLKLALRADATIDRPVEAASPFDQAALELARLALILPAVVVGHASGAHRDHLLRVAAGDVRAFRKMATSTLHIVGRAPVPLEEAGSCEFVVFRGGEGLRDQVAIVVGKPDFSMPVAVRLHSACLTGDLFGSLKCDCGDQLRHTVRWMAKNGGGVLLYLDQEGRGSGIANKMRAYMLQSEGFDTYDADEILGFELDQRHYEFAAEMLRQLGVGRVRILTNNPGKIEALKSAGFEVVAEQRVNGRPTAENQQYLTSKRDRAGHFIDIEALLARPAD
jgi:GTP cyclohydrolase II